MDAVKSYAEEDDDEVCWSRCRSWSSRVGAGSGGTVGVGLDALDDASVGVGVAEVDL